MAACLAVVAFAVCGVGAVSPARASAPVASAVAPAAPGIAESPPRDYLAEARASFTLENRAYQRERTLLNLAGPLFSVALGVLLLFAGVAQRLRDLAMTRARGRWARVLVFFSLYSLVLFVVQLPLAWYQGFALEHRYGLSTQTLAAWGLDEVKSLALQVVVVGVVPLLALAWRAIEASPRRWWLWLALGTLPVVTAGVLLEPLVVDPLFNKFTPLHDVALRDHILALAARADVPARNVYEVDMSARTRKINAYVSGFGASQRIVLWDTALQKLSRDEILFVMGHEMGHYVLRHIWKGLAAIALGAFAVFGFTAWLVDVALARFGERWQVRTPGDLAAMPLVLAMLGLVSFLGAPLSHVVSRAIEHEADVYALELTHDNDAGARSFLKLAQGNRSDPEPATWVKVLLFTHPPLGERIRFAQAYRPWEHGEPNRLLRGR